MKLLEKKNIRVVEFSEEYLEKLIYVVQNAMFNDSENENELIKIAERLYKDLLNLR